MLPPSQMVFLYKAVQISTTLQHRVPNKKQTEHISKKLSQIPHVTLSSPALCLTPRYHVLFVLFVMTVVCVVCVVQYNDNEHF